MNIAIYTSRKATRFLKAIETGSDDFRRDIKIIVSEDAFGDESLSLLKENDIHYSRFPFLAGERRKWSDSICDILNEYKIDYLLCNGRHILEGKILSEYEGRIVNFHAALLPQYKGRFQLDKMLNDNLFLVGTSAQFLVEELDGGPIIMESVTMQKAFELGGYDAVLEPQVDMIHMVYKLLKENRIHLENGQVQIDGADYTASCIFPVIN